MEHVHCIICGSIESSHLFSKGSGSGGLFDLVRCSNCGLEFLNPRPTAEEIVEYYDARYFTKRTDRGYDNYFSENIRNEIERVFALNLRDLGFYEFEKKIQGTKRALDIGCAAGYFVSFLKERGWDSRGIDVSSVCVDYARGHGLAVIEGNYLDYTFSSGFDLITLWASIEHLHHPHLFLKKIYRDLDDHGMVYLSTCRTGGINFMRLKGENWRFYNFPEHLYFFSRSTLKKILEDNGFEITGYATYGSGFGPAGSMIRKAADHAAKKFNMGDMMLVSFKKTGGR